MEHHPPPGRPRCGSPGAPPCRIRVIPCGPARRPDGQVVLLLLAHLRAHPQLDFSPYELAKLLRLSHGTVRRHLLRLWLEVPGMRPVHPHIRKNGIAAVPGRTPSYDWSRLTNNRN